MNIQQCSYENNIIQCLCIYIFFMLVVMKKDGTWSIQSHRTWEADGWNIMKFSRTTCFQRNLWTNLNQQSEVQKFASPSWGILNLTLNMPTRDLHPWSHSLCEETASAQKKGWFHVARVFGWLHITNWSTQTELAVQSRILHFVSYCCQSCS